MAENAGYSALIKIGSTTTYADATTINKITSISPDDAADPLDTSYLGAGQYKSSIQGMKQVTISIDLNKDTADTGQNTLRSRLGDGALFYLWVLTDGTNGKYYPMRAFSMSESSATADLVTQSFSLEGQGAPVAHP